MKLTEGQLLFRLQDFQGAEQEALGIGDYEFAQESADIANALRELLQARRTIEELTAVVEQRNGECVRLHSELESRTVKLPDDEDGQAYGFGKWSNGKLPATAGTMTISYCEDAWRAAFEVFSSAAGIKVEAK